MQFDYLTVTKELKKELDKYSKTGKVVTRFPPEPSGYLHLGHVKALSINYCIANKYKGDMILRMDDTNPALESDEFESSIIEDVKKLEVKFSRLTYTSDYFGELVKCADTLIASGDAYVDLTDAKIMKEQRNEEVDSKYRDTSVEENLKLWSQLKSGELSSGCVRLKIDMKSKNKAMRDPGIYRACKDHHHRTKDTYKVYPTYDFSCPIVDSLENVTHVFRSREFQERDEMCVWILSKLKMPIPKLYHYGRINITGSVMSKRKIKELVSSGTYSGWDDPRLYTLRGLLNRGITYSTLDIFMKETGYSVSNVDIEPSTLWGINRKVIDKIATRFSVIGSDGIKINLDLPADLPNSKDVLKFHRNSSLGILINSSDAKLLADNEESTLMNFGNVVYKDQKFVSKLDGDPKTTKNKLIWVPVKCAEVEIIDYDQKDIKIVTRYYGETAIKDIKVGDFVQFMKMDYYRCVSINGDKVTFIRIP